MTRRTEWPVPGGPEDPGRAGPDPAGPDGTGPDDGLWRPWDLEEPGEPEEAAELAEPGGSAPGGTGVPGGTRRPRGSRFSGRSRRPADGGLPDPDVQADGPGDDDRSGRTAGRTASRNEAGGERGRGTRRRGRPRGHHDSDSPSPSRAGQGESPRDPAERARAICLRLLTGTPRTRRQLADALRERDVPDEVAEEVLTRFEEVGLIDDGAFAGAWVESRHHGRGLARRALARELRTKGVDSELIDQAVARLDPDQEEATARALVARRLRGTRGLDRDKRVRRLAGVLARKGYSEGLALRVVREALREEAEHDDGTSPESAPEEWDNGED
ncbi:recombination regulator RecX [Streptomyces sp. JNUCC 64]